MAYNPKTKQMKRSPNAFFGIRTLGPNGSFQAGDKKHERLAISGATRSYNARHISKSTQTRIQSEARTLLNKGKPKSPKKPMRRGTVKKGK